LFEELYQSCIQLAGEQGIDKETLHEHLQEYIRNHLCVAPDGMLPNSSLIHRVRKWLQSHNVNLHQLIVDLKDSNKPKETEEKEDEVRKKRSEEYRAKLHAMLDTMREQVRKPEPEPEPTDDDDEKGENGSGTGTRRFRYQKGIPPPRQKLNLELVREDVLPLHIIKGMEHPWFCRIEPKVSLIVWDVSMCTTNVR
jgi:DNA-binding transcriptional MerR regulator